MHVVLPVPYIPNLLGLVLFWNYTPGKKKVHLLLLHTKVLDAEKRKKNHSKYSNNLILHWFIIESL